VTEVYLEMGPFPYFLALEVAPEPGCGQVPCKDRATIDSTPQQRPGLRA
jgi:hypothetical protein